MTSSEHPVDHGIPTFTGEVLTTTDRAQVRREVMWSRTVAWWMDDLVRVPGTGFGIGLDAVLGFIPLAGDATTTVVAVVIMADAVRLRVPLPVLARMGLNIAIDAALGAIPVIGDLADVAHRANRRNYRLLRQVVADRDRARSNSVGYLLGAAALLTGTALLLVAGVVWTGWMIWRLLVG
ncbi:hypothetical protein HMPREF1531_00186 [Propionibacterium sp. oral taxon 192 str. F0372]|uniref:DUF4112 domain-containing protein n=1 Tax=Propionibacterium sp. oral taxon 192 TaxID=671222 RepID=UPI0003532712|nr:DUF4112 domain-containing protein [Propionibacterium sp. oral taxon 192]EPH07137.1 hypothetical protein HMPREF1531_00186 [Propionibacterium sp. oral taxon 192 str. F0372]